MEQTYRLLTGSRRLDIATVSTGTSDRPTCKPLPAAMHSHEATYETLYGDPPPDPRNTSSDAARYEAADIARRTLRAGLRRRTPQ